MTEDGTFKMELPEDMEFSEDVCLPEIAAVKAVIRKVVIGEDGNICETEEIAEFPKEETDGEGSRQ